MGFLLSFPHVGVDVIQGKQLGVITRSTTSPFSSTRISSALITVDRRWAIITVVRSMRHLLRRPISFSVWVSRADVASSKMRISGDFRSFARWRPVVFPPTVLIPARQHGCCSHREAPPQSHGSWRAALHFQFPWAWRPADHRKCYKRQYR